jgi:hypothetical protein
MVIKLKMQMQNIGSAYAENTIECFAYKENPSDFLALKFQRKF